MGKQEENNKETAGNIALKKKLFLIALLKKVIKIDFIPLNKQGVIIAQDILKDLTI